MNIFVNPAGDLPIYRQIMRQITDAIAARVLKAGEKLPSHRELSEQLVIAPLTVKKAYDELEALRFIETQRGRGTFVCTRLPQSDPVHQRNEIEETARRLLSQAYLAGLRYEEVITILKETNLELTGEKIRR